MTKCDQIWRKSLDIFEKLYLVLGNIMNLFGLKKVVVKLGQMLKNCVWPSGHTAHKRTNFSLFERTKQKNLLDLRSSQH